MCRRRRASVPPLVRTVCTALSEIGRLYTLNWVTVVFLEEGCFFFFVDNRIVLQMCLKGALRSAESCGETATVQSEPAEVYQR